MTTAIPSKRTVNFTISKTIWNLQGDLSLRGCISPNHAFVAGSSVGNRDLIIEIANAQLRLEFQSGCFQS